MKEFIMENKYEKFYGCYPAPAEVDAWIEEMHADAEKADFTAEDLGGYMPCSYGQFHNPGLLIKFTRDGHEYWGVFHNKLHGAPAPLLVQLPGYGAELSSHWDVASRGYNVLQLSPLGYWTPNGFNESLKKDGNWPVLPDTARTDAKGGYRDWLLDVICAVKWAWKRYNVLENRVSFYGTSQGGGTSLLMGSIFAGRGTSCVCADEPFLTDYPLAAFRGAYGVTVTGIEDAARERGEEAAWRALGFADTICHAHRMNYPVLLTGGGRDDVCPPETVESLFGRLPQTKSYTFLHRHPHGYNTDFIKLACAWFELYA